MDIEQYREKIARLAEQLVKECSKRGLKLSCAESCTGGLISGAITSVSGSSAVIELGICSYSNRIKHEILGVDDGIFEKYTEYSVECAKAMANGVRRLSGADFSVSTTGVAGPSGGSTEHPVGEVCIAVSSAAACRGMLCLFGEKGGRELIRAAAVEKALELLLEEINR